MNGSFVNLSNHPSVRWCAAQIGAARAVAASVVDLPFPSVDPTLGTEAVEVIARSVLDQLPHDTVCVHLAGECTLVVALVRLLQVRGVRVVASTTARRFESSGRSSFEFVRFRDYPAT